MSNETKVSHHYSLLVLMRKPWGRATIYRYLVYLGVPTGNRTLEA